MAKFFVSLSTLCLADFLLKLGFKPFIEPGTKVA